MCIRDRHDLIFFRQIAANIYRNNKRWEKSIALSKQDKLYKDAIETSAISAKPEIVEDLLRYVSLLSLSLLETLLIATSLSISVAASATLACFMPATTSSAPTS